MATNKRDLKAYSRFDGTGRIVPGSTVLRRNKPKVGNWKEVQAYECCDDICPPCNCNSFNYEFIITTENLADATGNTGIGVRVGQNIITTGNNFVYYQEFKCDGSGGWGLIAEPQTLTYCVVTGLLYYFKNDSPIFLEVINTEVPCVN